MGKAAKAKMSKRVRRPLPPPTATFEATPERLAQAGNDNSTLVPAIIHRAADRQARCRRFRDSHVDRMFKAHRLTYAQWYAADWYRSKYELSGLPTRVVGSYGAGAGAGECDYGLPVSERQARARQQWRAARSAMPDNMLPLVDNLVLHDLAPVLGGGNQRARYTDAIARALQLLAEYLNAT